MKAGTAGRLILAVAGVLAVAVAAGAQGFGPGGQGPGPRVGGNRPPMERAFGPMGGERGWWNNPRIVDRLKLSDDQRKAMDGILLDHKEKLIDLRANLEKAELAMQPLMSADTPNDAAMTAQIDRVVAARAELERANARFLLAIRDKLTPDQWKQVRTFGENRGAMQHQEWRRDGQQRDGQHGMPGPGARFHRQQQPGQQQAPPPPAAAPGTGTGQPGAGTGEVQ